MNNRKIIAFSGKATSGKTAAALLLGKYVMYEGTIFRKISVADSLRRMTTDWFPLNIEDLKNRKTEIINLGGRELTIRQVMIELGCKMREINPDIWVDNMWKDVELQSQTSSFHAEPPEILITIDDIRFPNEYELLKEKGAILIRIERPGVDLIDDISETSLDNHEFDHVIQNDGTLDDLSHNIIQCYKQYLTVK